MKANGVVIIAVNDTFTNRASVATVKFIPMTINLAYQTFTILPTYTFNFRTVLTFGVVNKKT